MTAENETDRAKYAKKVTKLHYGSAELWHAEIIAVVPRPLS